MENVRLKYDHWSLREHVNCKCLSCWPNSKSECDVTWKLWHNWIFKYIFIWKLTQKNCMNIQIYSKIWILSHSFTHEQMSKIYLYKQIWHEQIFLTNIFAYSNIFVTLCSKWFKFLPERYKPRIVSGQFLDLSERFDLVVWHV